MRFRQNLLIAAFAVLTSPVVAADPVYMTDRAPYAENARIAKKVRDECVKLNEQLPAYTAEFAREFGIEIELRSEVESIDKGRVLVVEIVDAVSRGNAFIGHQKFSEVEGTLYEDGEPVASFRGVRNSMGGAFAGYKGSCSVLGRTIKALGKDIAMWLKSPEDEAELGDY